MLVDYDPEKHRGLPLFELQSEEGESGSIVTRAVPTSISHEIAARMPWYYMVEVDGGAKGGPGSGNYGHAGRPGEVGGSAPASGGGSPTGSGFNADEWSSLGMNDRRDKWESLSARQRDKMTNAANRIPVNQAGVLSHAGDRPEFSSDIKASITKRLEQTTKINGEDFIPTDDTKLISDTLFEMDDALAEVGVDPKLRHALAMEATDALVAQDREALGRTLGDHGIRHLRGNVEIAKEILAAHPDTDTAGDIAETYVAQVFHDTGYLTDPSRIFLDEGHARWGAQHYDANIRPLVEKALGRRAAGEISHIIRTHASTDVDWDEDVLASASRIADNMALFHKEKLPPLFRFVSSSTSILEDLGTGKITASKAQQLLTKKVNGTNLSASIKKQLSGAIGEISPVSPKFILGMLGGSIGKIVWKGNHLVITLQRNTEATRLQKVLDLGQRQFAKFAKTYGYDADHFLESLQFEFKDPQGNTLIESIIEEIKMLAALKALGLSKSEREEIVRGLKDAIEEYPEVVELLKGGPGSGFHGHAGRPGQRGGSAPGRGSLPAFQIGITSARPEKTDVEVIRRDMEKFRDDMSKTPVKDLSVKMGTGAWYGGGEPSWVTTYKGDGEAVKVIAATAKKYEQEGALVMRLARPGEKGDPLSEFTFDTDLTQDEITAIGNVLADHGFKNGGWTWSQRNGKAFLQVAYVRDWADFTPEAHNGYIKEAKKALAEAGWGTSLNTGSIVTTTLDASNYDDFISGKREFN